MQGESSGQDQVRAAEVIATLSLATDLGIGLPLEHGLHSTVCAMRLGDVLGVDGATASRAYFGCLLFYVGCTTDAELTADLFADGALLEHVNPVIFGSSLETIGGIMRALAGEGIPPVRSLRVARNLPRAVRGHRRHVTAMCELAHLRVSQINGCSPCVDSGTRQAKKAGESDERLFAVAAWRDAPYFTDAGRAALALAEAVTRLSDRTHPVPDEIWDEAARHYDEPAPGADLRKADRDRLPTSGVGARSRSSSTPATSPTGRNLQDGRESCVAVGLRPTPKPASTASGRPGRV